MKKITLFIAILFLASLSSYSQENSFTWKKTAINGSRTGVVASSASNVEEAMGYVKGGTYYAPNGKKFRKGTVRNVASIMLDAQPEMARVKQVIGYSTRVMERRGPECELYDWLIDEFMRAVEDSTGRKVDIGITNRGGVRTDMPQGEVLYDDIMSMFPFKNRFCYVSLYGRDIRATLEKMAKRSIEIMGGVRMVVQNKKLISAEIGGQPIEDDKIYGVATIDFLLDGGDGLSLGKNAIERVTCEGYIYDTMLKYVMNLTAAGKPIEYKTDGRIRILKEGESL